MGGVLAAGLLEVEQAMLVQPCLEAIWHHESGRGRLDYRRANNVVAWLERLHLPEFGIQPALVPVERARAQTGFRGRDRAAVRILRQHRLLSSDQTAHDDCGHREAQLGRARGAGIDAPVSLLEGRSDLLPVLRTAGVAER